MTEDRVKKTYRIDPETGRLRLGKIEVPVPRSRPVRIFLGSGLIAGGFLGFLPVLGFWMLPLGVIVLSHDLTSVRRAKRRFSVWWSRRRERRR